MYCFIYIHWNLVYSMTLFIVQYYFYAFLRFQKYIIYNPEAFTFCTSKYTMKRFRNVHYISLKYSIMFTVYMNCLCSDIMTVYLSIVVHLQW